MYGSSRISSHNTVRFNISCNYRTSSYDCSISNRHSVKNSNAITNPNIISNAWQWSSTMLDIFISNFLFSYIVFYFHEIMSICCFFIISKHQMIRYKIGGMSCKTDIYRVSEHTKSTYTLTLYCTIRSFMMD